MSFDLKTEARQQLDKKLRRLQPASRWVSPPRGWIRAIRRSLGLSARQLAERLGVKPPRVLAIENAEVRGGLTLRTLAKVAQSLDCTLVYALVPNDSLEKSVQNRARRIARRRLATVDHTMSLEAQATSSTAQKRELDRLTEQIIRQELRHIWEEKQ
jgi:predicted DNA-binding mobile mystery protein A